MDLFPEDQADDGEPRDPVSPAAFGGCVFAAVAVTVGWVSLVLWLVGRILDRLIGVNG